MNFRVSARAVLELGSELISSDIIAFYELVKNAFDAGSSSGADIRFRIVLRRNSYIRIRNAAQQLLPPKDQTKDEKKEAVRRWPSERSELLEAVESKLDPRGGSETTGKILEALRTTGDPEDFIGCLDACYDEHNWIEVIDTGSGMSLKEITSNYLTLGTPSRKRQVETILKSGGSKTPLGEKGIGRLSAMRLGHRLSVQTARAEEAKLNLLDIDWRAFERLDLMIEDVKIEPKVGGPKDKDRPQGTKLRISGLLEDWTEDRVRELADKEFAKLTDPFLDPKDRPRIALFWYELRISIPWLDRSLIESAHASLKGKYRVRRGKPTLVLDMVATKLGSLKHDEETDSLVLTQEDFEGLLDGNENRLPDGALETVGDFDFEMYWYNRRLLTRMDGIGDLAAVRKRVSKWSGVMLFRDGFRVFPYGEKKDDWLKLDEVALGRTGFVLNKNQFIGRVQITRAGNSRLVDQTNREGLRETPESSVFLGVLSDAVTFRLWSFFKEVDLKYRKRTDLGDDVEGDIQTLEARAKTAIKKIGRYVPKEDRDAIAELEHALREFQELSSNARLRMEEIEEDSRQMVHMAGVGLLVEMVAHELARSTEAALASLEGLKGKDLPSDVKSRIDTLRAEINSVSKRLRVLDEASVPGRQRAETFDLVKLIEELKEGHAPQFDRDGMEMRIRAPKAPVRVKLVKGMVVQILENLVANSVYWMRIRAGRERSYRPTIDIRVTADPLRIRFSDNGRGIAPGHRERVFRAYWSLKEKSKRRGLGLFIAQANAKELKGELTLSDKEDENTGRLHEFVLDLPDSSVVE